MLEGLESIDSGATKVYQSKAFGWIFEDWGPKIYGPSGNELAVWTKV